MKIVVNVDKLRNQLTEVGVSSASELSVSDVIALHASLQKSGVMDRYYSCTRKIKFGTLEQATLGSYQQEVFRRGVREYVPYKCRYCWAYHVGRKDNPNRGKR